MSGFDMDMPDDFEGGGNFLQEPGTYHLLVLRVDEAPTNNKGDLLDGFRVDCAVLDGTTPGQKDRQTDIMFFRPKLSDKNGGEFAKRKQARFAIATGILGQATPGQRVTVDLQRAAGMQFVAELEHEIDKDTKQPKKFLQLAWANIWHVDDPAVSQVPKDAAALELLPAAMRRSAESFAKKDKPSGGAGSTAAKPQDKPTPPTQPPKQAAVNVDDL
jgi:hypothetical protein